MFAIDVIEDFEKMLSESEENFALPRDTILNILDSYKSDLGEDGFGEEGRSARMAHYFAGSIEYRREVHEIDLEYYRTVNSAGQSAMRSAFLMNGGAAIAVSAFIGALASGNNPQISVVSLGDPLALFAFGTLSAAVAFGTTYLAQLLSGYVVQTEKWRSISALWINNCAIVASITSYLMFALGLWQTYSSFS